MKKGFTLVEILSVIAILGLILIIGVPKINNLIDESRKKAFETNVTGVMNAVKNHYQSNFIGKLDANVITYDVSDTGILYEENDIDYTQGKIDFIGTININEDGRVKLALSNGEYCATKSYITDLIITEIDANNECEISGEEKVLLMVNLNGGTTTQTFENMYTKDDEITLITPTRSGYNFSRWEIVEGDSTLNNDVLTIGELDTVIRAVWIGSPHELSVELNGGTMSQAFESTYLTGSTILLGTPKKAGYSFGGWEVTSGNSILSGNILTMGSSDTVVTAQYNNCASGTYNDGTSSSCTACPENMTSNLGSTSIADCGITCAGGSYLKAGTNSCSTCLAGNYCEGDLYNYNEGVDQGMVICPAGTYSNAGQASCSICTGNKTSDTGSSSCTLDCANSSGVSTWSTSETCTVATCAAGYKKEGNSCVMCPAGTYSSAGSTSCSSCAAGTYSGSGAASCTTCPSNTYSEAGAGSCSSCPAGMTGGTNCSTTCAAGTYLKAGEGSCSSCPAGKYCVGGTFNYNASSDQGITGNCNTNTYSTGGASAATCTACPGSMTSTAGSTAKTSCKITCSAGNHLAKSASACSSCPAGKYCAGGTYNYSDSAAQGITGNCNANTYSTGGASAATCTACGGSLTSSAGATAKTQCKITCAAGKYLKAGGTSCISCPAGKYCTGGTQYNYNASSDQGITGNCNAGRFSTGGASAATCTACAKGSYSAAGASGCTACANGKTTSSTGSTSSSSCTACSNASNVSSWKTQSWSNNSVTNLCTINACASGYTNSSNTCVVNAYWTVGTTQYSNAWYCRQDNGCPSYCSGAFGNSTYSCGPPSDLPSSLNGSAPILDSTCWCKSSVPYNSSGWSYKQSYSNNWYCYTNCRADCVAAGKRNVFSCTDSTSAVPVAPSQSYGQYCWCNS